MKKIILVIIFIFSTLSFSDEIDVLTEGELGGYSYQENKEENSKYVISQVTKIRTFDPIKMRDNYSIRIVDFLYDTLFKYDLKGNITSNILENWSWKDKRTLYLKLKEGLKFSDGNSVTAEDIKESLYRLKNVGSFKELFSDIVNIDIISEKELEVKIKGKNKIFIPMLTYYMSAVVKEENGKIIGTGPYKIKKITNRNLVLERNIYSLNSAKYSEIDILYEVSQRKRAILCFDGEVNKVYDLSNTNIEKWKKEGIIDESIKVVPSDEMDTIALSFGNKESIFTEKENRKTLEAILYKEKYLDLQNINSFFPRRILDAKLSKINLENIDDKKCEILKGNTIEIVTLNNESYIDKANKLKIVLERYGMKVKLSIHNVESYELLLNKRDYQLAIRNIDYDQTRDIYNITKTVMYDIHDKEMYNGLFPFINIMKNEQKEEYRMKIYDKMVYLIYKNMPYIPLEHRNKFVLEKE